MEIPVNMAKLKLILDVGCGYGQATANLSKRGRVIGFDILPGIMKKAKNDYPAVEFCCMSAEKIGFADGCFDEIYCFDVLEHVDDINLTMKEISRVIKNKGSLIIEVPYSPSEKFLLKMNPEYLKETHHTRIFEKRELISLLKKNGFRVDKIIGKKFYDNMFFGFAFLNEQRILNQLGELSQGENKKLAEINTCLSQLTSRTMREVKNGLGQKAAQKTERMFGLSIEEIAFMVRAIDKLGSKVFPKSLRLECTYAPKETALSTTTIESEEVDLSWLTKNINMELKKDVSRVDALNVKIKDLNKTVAELNSRLYDMITEIQKRDKVIQDINRTTQEQVKMIQKRDKMIQDRDNTIKEMENELQAIYSSKSYRILTKMGVVKKSTGKKS